MQSAAMLKNGTKKEVNELKPYYSEFVRHCLRYYIKTIDDGMGGHPVFKSEADKANWNACHCILQHYSEENIEMIAFIYRQGDTIADKIHTLSKSKTISQDTLWSLVNNIERRVAKKRGLI